MYACYKRKYFSSILKDNMYDKLKWSAIRLIIDETDRSDMIWSSNTYSITWFITGQFFVTFSSMNTNQYLEEMNSKIFFVIYGVVYLAKEVIMEMDTSMEYGNIVRQVNMQSAIINNLQRVWSLSSQ